MFFLNYEHKNKSRNRSNYNSPKCVLQHDFKTMQHCFIKTNQFCSVAFYFFFILENANNQNLVILYEIPNIAKTRNI